MCVCDCHGPMLLQHLWLRCCLKLPILSSNFSSLCVPVFIYLQRYPVFLSHFVRVSLSPFNPLSNSLLSLLASFSFSLSRSFLLLPPLPPPPSHWTLFLFLFISSRLAGVPGFQLEWISNARGAFCQFSLISTCLKRLVQQVQATNSETSRERMLERSSSRVVVLESSEEKNPCIRGQPEMLRHWLKADDSTRQFKTSDLSIQFFWERKFPTRHLGPQAESRTVVNRVELAPWCNR